MLHALKQNREIVVFGVMLAMTIFVLCLALQGCAGSCIKVAGGYQDATGEMEYCFDKEKAKSMQTPVLSDSEGQTFFGITEEEIKAIVEKLKSKVAGALTEETEHPFLQLRKLLK